MTQPLKDLKEQYMACRKAGHKAEVIVPPTWEDAITYPGGHKVLMGNGRVTIIRAQCPTCDALLDAVVVRPATDETIAAEVEKLKKRFG